MGMHRDHGEFVIAPVKKWSRVVVVALIALAGVLSAIGMFVWTPDNDRLDSVSELVPLGTEGIELVEGELVSVRAACEGPADDSCGLSTVRATSGPNAGATGQISLGPDVLASGVQAGDRVELIDQTSISSEGVPPFAFYSANRDAPMLTIVLIFVVAVIAVARFRGLMALISLGFAGAIVLLYLIPALLSGQPAVPTTLAASVLILIVMLYATHGISMRTSVALLGALVGVAISVAISWYFVIGSRLGGRGNEEAALLAFNVDWLNVQQLIMASVILAGLGTLNDVTITQVSALWELKAVAPTLSRAELFRRAMRIGRDHVASTVYTLVFAYLGTALIALIGARLFAGSYRTFLSAENVAEEVLRALVGGVALVLAMPITTAIGVLVIKTNAVPRSLTNAPPTRHQSPAGELVEPSMQWRLDERPDDTRWSPRDPW